MADFLDNPFERPLYSTTVTDTDLASRGSLTFGAQDDGWFGSSPGVFYRRGNIESGIRFPSALGDESSDNREYMADMSVRQQLDVMKKRISRAADPAQSSLMIDDMNHLKDGYRGLKADGWDSGRAASAASQTYYAFGTYSNLKDRAAWLDDMSRQRGVEISDVTRRVKLHRDAFRQQYLTDIGFVNGSNPSAINTATADDEFAEAFRSVKGVEDKFGVMFDDTVYGDVMKYVSKASALLANNGASARDVGMDKIVDAALHACGAMTGAAEGNPVTGLLVAQNADRRGISWSDYDVFPEDPVSGVSGDSMNGIAYGKQKTVAGQVNEQDFSMSRGIREAFTKQYVRNMREGRDVTDFSDTETLRQDLVNSFKLNSMSTSGLGDNDFGQLADAIIAKRSRGERINVTDTVKEMLYAPDPQAVPAADRRHYARTVNGAWGNGFTSLVTQFQKDGFDPAKTGAAVKAFEDGVKTSGMTDGAQKIIMKMTSDFVNDKKFSEHWSPEAVKNQEADDSGHPRPQVFKHELTQIAQATQLVSLVDACRQGKVISDEEADGLINSFYDQKTGKINLGVFHTVNAGLGHLSERDTMQNWLLKTDRPFDGIGWFADTKVRAVNEDPLERTFRTLNDKLAGSNVQGLGDVRDIVGKTVGIMDQFRSTYDAISKDSNGYLRSSHVFTPDQETSALRKAEDVSAGLIFGETVSNWFGLSDRAKFRKNMRLAEKMMSELKASGSFVPGLEESGYDDSFASLKIAGRWDSVSQATIRASQADDPAANKLLYGVDPQKAEAWASWTRNQTMDTPAAKASVDRIASSLYDSFMKDHPGLSGNRPVAQRAKASLFRLVRNNWIAGNTAAGMDDLEDRGDELIDVASQLGTKPNNGKNGWQTFGGDFQLASELSDILSPLQNESTRRYDMLRQIEQQQQVLLANQMGKSLRPQDVADPQAVSSETEETLQPGDDNLQPQNPQVDADALAAANVLVAEKENQLGRKLSRRERELIIRAATLK